LITIATTLKRCAQTALHEVQRRLLAWSRPATGSRIGSTVGDLTRTRATLVAENALLRHQLVVFQRQVGRPVFTPADLCWPFSPSAPRSWHSRIWTASESLRIE